MVASGTSYTLYRFLTAPQHASFTISTSYIVRLESNYNWHSSEPYIYDFHTQVEWEGGLEICHSVAYSIVFNQ